MTEPTRDQVAETLFYAVRRDDWGAANDWEREEFYDMADAMRELFSQPTPTAETFQPAPDGWFTFGSHVGFEGALEFSEERDASGDPLWERHPTGKSVHVEYGIVLDDLGSTDIYDTEAEARAAATADTPVVKIVTFPLDPETPAEPHRIEDMAAGTTFTARLELMDGLTNRRTFMRVDGVDVVEEAGARWHPQDIDPSTIRDVLPPHA